MAIYSSERSSTGIAGAFRQHVVMLIRIFSHESHQEQTPVPTHWQTFCAICCDCRPTSLRSAHSRVSCQGICSTILHIDCIQYDSGLCKFASLHLIMQTFANLPAIEEHGALSFAPTAHMMTCGLFSNMFLCCIFIVQCFPASLRITHIIKEMFVYIYNRPNVHVYYIYMYIIIYTVFPCLQDLARLKIAFYILAHVAKSLLDPDLGWSLCHATQLIVHQGRSTLLPTVWYDKLILRC